ncbi:hypothetical protein F4553_000242 [Allocatelliglobosispora scoriae]|uniref:Uncharacterized protein n=1 Tax=Allocatelliglobosispora scoriae TaxID=643052 RepID=A0A841BIH3_9ACTN|nr:Ig domain-containing protein [Allocatelliglobosispora scoriae]MBB5866863.1 hypothetical protein [Allocatelliglobosispora scoriae]
MSRIRWYRSATAAALVLSAVVFGSALPARATTATAAAPTGVVAGRPATVTKATLEEIQAIAARGNGKLLTLNAGAGTSAVITCVLTISPPFGGGSPGSSVQVDSALQCTDWMDFLSLFVQLRRDVSLVGSSTVALPVSYTLYGSARETSCQYGIYWGVATAFMRRSGYTPPSAYLHVNSVPLPVGCGSTPPPPPPPPTGAITVTNPGSQSSYYRDPAYLQMKATGGSGTYNWSASGLPTGMSINPSTGLITGPATTIGTYSVTVTAVGGVGLSGYTSFTWSVRHEPCPRC